MPSMKSLSIVSLVVSACASPDGGSPPPTADPRLVEAAQEILEVHCAAPDDALVEQGVTREHLDLVRATCALSRDELVRDLQQRIEDARAEAALFSYACYSSGWNFDIPTRADLGLSASTCTWHDPNPLLCKEEQGIACLWGCNNIDPQLGWHTKHYASRAAAEADLKPKGYKWLIQSSDFSREIGKGFRYQVHGPASGAGTWHSEGPEPSPAFNWVAYLGGWWPGRVYAWHQQC